MARTMVPLAKKSGVISSTTLLERYEIVSELGRGAIGIVYRAFDRVLERAVAIKTLKPDLPEDIADEMKARFVREAKSAGRLNHPNIITIYDAAVADDIAYIAMEYLEGQSLQQLMQLQRPLGFDTVVGIVAQVAEGLDYAGRFDIVHRDIKPANIMVAPTGVAKITDFGLARMPSSSMTLAGTVLGSPKYMSPEQVQEQPVDPRADIFSLGVVLYEMLVGKRPFEAPNLDMISLLDRIVAEPAPPPSRARPDLPVGVDAIVKRALAKRPDDRFHRGRDLAQSLRGVMAPRASAAFGGDIEPSLVDPTARINLSEVLAELEAVSRRERAAEAADALNTQMRQAFHYFEELVRHVICAHPPFAAKIGIVYVGALPAAELGDGQVECATKKIGDVECVDRLTLSYRMTSPRKARIVLNRKEARSLRRQLERANVKFDSREIMDDAGAVRFEAFLIEVDLPARAELRADYEQQTLEIACQNVGVLGPANYRLSSKQFDEVIWEFGEFLLGLPSRFAGLRLPSPETP